MNKKRELICMMLVVIMLTPSLFIYHVSGEPNYQNVDVQQAKHLIDETPNIIVLDVRNGSEFSVGHLHNAISLPLNAIQLFFTMQTQTKNGSNVPSLPPDSRILDLKQHINEIVLVYCQGGSRSAQAVQILADNGFSDVYNMVGGITAWMNAHYPIYTTEHYVTVDKVAHKTVIDIEPFLLHSSNCIPCQRSTGTCSNNLPLNTSETLLEDYGNRTVTLLSAEVNGTTYESTIDRTILWSSNETTEQANRTTSFNSMIYSRNGTSEHTFVLSDTVKTNNSSLQITTVLTPLDSETYNSSLTYINYYPAGKSALQTYEEVRFNNSLSLSDMYKELAKVTEKIGEKYGEDADNSLHIFADRYDIIANEISQLSDVAKNELAQYDLVILNIGAAILDDAITCLLCRSLFAIAVEGGCALIGTCTAGLGWVICNLILSYVNYWQSGLYFVCYDLIDCMSYGVPDYNYLTWTDKYEYAGALVNYPEGATDYLPNGQRCQIWCPNPPAMGQLIGSFDEEYVHGEIQFWGFSWIGYYSDLYIFVSNDNYNWDYVGFQEITQEYPGDWIDFGYYPYCFRYINLCGYDSGYSVDLLVDCVTVTP